MSYPNSSSVKTYNQVADHVSVAVGAALTLLVAAFQLISYDSCFYEFTNNDGSQSLNVQIEGSAAATGPWNVLDAVTFNAIGAGATVNSQYSATGFRYIRVRGIASGAGLNATVTVRQGGDGA